MTAAETADATQDQVEESVIDAMQRILGTRRHEDYTEDTILGSDINQIRHLFYYLRAEEKSLGLSYLTDNYRASIVDIADAQARLHVPGFEIGAVRRCRIKFEGFSQLYQFEVPILEIEDEFITIRIPAFIQSVQRRRYKRIYVDDLLLRFIILYRPIFASRETTQFIDSRYPHIIQELEKDEPDLALINRIITEEIARITPNYEFKFYEKGERLGVMEGTIMEEARPVFIRNVADLESYYERPRNYGLTNYHKEFNHMVRFGSEEEARRTFQDLRNTDMQNFIRNYVCSPLIIFDKVVGHIYLYSTVFGNEIISVEQAQQINLLTQLLNYAMSKTAIARTFFTHSLTRVVNLSLGGMLFELNNQILFDYLTFHDKLRVVLQIRYHLLTMEGEVTRYFPTPNGYNVGFRFFKASPDAYRVLEQFIFDRSRLTFQ